MYSPPVFRETRAEVIERAMVEYPLATLVTLGTAGLEASHIPLLYAKSADGKGVLRGHLARANPQWRNYVDGSEALAIFQGPQHYVSPSWYPSGKENGKVVPTWNYVAVQVRGKLAVRSEPEWLRENVTALTDAQEKFLEAPWRVEDAPKEFIDGMVGRIIGVELTITEIEGKWKVGQNRPTQDREGAIAGLETLGTAESIRMAGLVRAALNSRKILEQ